MTRGFSDLRIRDGPLPNNRDTAFNKDVFLLSAGHRDNTPDLSSYCNIAILPRDSNQHTYMNINLYFGSESKQLYL